MQQMANALNQAYQHWNAGHADQAEQLCRQVLATWPGQTDALHLLGLMAHAYGKLPLAIDYLRQACQAPRAPALYFRNLAEMCRQQGLLAEGEQAGRQAVAMEPLDAAGWNNLGILLQEAGKIGESIDCLQRANQLQPDNPSTLNNLGNTCRLAGRTDEAERCYRAALALAPEYAQAYSNLASLETARGNPEAAIALAQEALACEPQFADAYLNLADAELARANGDGAQHWLNALLTFAPNHPLALSGMARLQLQSGQPAQALDNARRAAMLAPGSGTVQWRLGEACEANGLADEALAAYERAAALPGFAVLPALIAWGRLLCAGSRRDEAEAVFERARAAFPQQAPALIAALDQPASGATGQ